MKIDTIGLRCPEPLMIVRQKLRTINNDEINFSPKKGLDAVLSFGSFKQGGNIIKA